jgi:hypothetical protein
MANKDRQVRIVNLDYKLVVHLSRKEINTLAVIARFEGNIKTLIAGWAEVSRDAGNDWEATLSDIFSEIRAVHQEDKEFIKRIQSNA